MKSYYIAIGLACSCFADTPQGSTTATTNSIYDLSLAKLKPPAIAFAALPSAATYPRYVFEIYDCATVACTSGGGTIPGWKGSDGSAWITMSGGGSGSPSGPFLVVTFSATQTVDVSTCGVCRITLTANMTSLTLTGGSTDRPGTIIEFKQDGTGSRTIAGLDGAITGFCTILGTAGSTTTQSLIYDGTNYIGKGCGDTSTAIFLPGSTSGGVSLKAPAVAGANTVTFPAGTTDFSGTGGDHFFVGQDSVGAALTVYRPACADLSDAGAGCTGTGATTSTGVQWVFGVPGYAPGPAGLLVNNGVANRGSIFMPTIAISSTSTQLIYNVAVVGGGGAGILFAYYNSAMTAPVCVSTVGTTTGVTALGGHVLTWASGSGVSGGICTRPVGAPLVMTSDDTSIKLIAFYDQAAVDSLRLLNPTPAGSATGNIYAAYTGSVISSGTGGSLAFTTDLSAISWTSFAAGSSSTLPVMAQK